MQTRVELENPIIKEPATTVYCYYLSPLEKLAQQMGRERKERTEEE